MADNYQSEQKPNNEKDFSIWFSDKFKFYEKDYSNYYDIATNNLKDSFCASPFWTKVKQLIKEWDNHYYSIYGVNLFTSDDAPEVVIKSLSSLLNKVYRKDILKNSMFPNPPDGDWITPDNWFDKIHDIIRTTFVVKYLDGVKFVVSKLKELAEGLGLSEEFICDYEAKDEGYYAAHAGLRMHMGLITKQWEKEEHTIEVEIQITTELQEMIKKLLHKYYDKNRVSIKPKDYKWQWDYESEQFAPNYMGHIAHYIEGMIVEIRDKQNKEQ